MGITVIVGLMIFLVLNSGMVLYAKNTSINTAHQQARAGVDQMLQNIHSSVSIPQLVDATLKPIAILDGSGNPATAPGISFQSFSAGPFPVVVGASATDTSITLYCPGYTPPVGARLNIPSHNIEFDIVSTTASGANLKFNLNTPQPPNPPPYGIGTAIDIAGTGVEGGTGTTYIITAFITVRRAYAVVGGDLRYCPSVTSNHLADLINSKVITRNITSASPFTIPFGPGSPPTPQNNFVAAVNLSTADPAGSARGYGAVDMFISSKIPFRSRLTNSQ